MNNTWEHLLLIAHSRPRRYFLPLSMRPGSIPGSRLRCASGVSKSTSTDEKPSHGATSLLLRFWTTQVRISSPDFAIECCNPLMLSRKIRVARTGLENPSARRNAIMTPRLILRLSGCKVRHGNFIMNMKCAVLRQLQICNASLCTVVMPRVWPSLQSPAPFHLPAQV